uniref:Protein FAM227B-like n=1 Tax=Camelus bactrianus TaxID=9837 RepID=A0A9W3HQ80_CAMBA|nr:protein FAM227B-like [Camelus bactrianus]
MEVSKLLIYSFSVRTACFILKCNFILWFYREKHIINEEIKLLRQRQERINKEIHRLQAKATKKPNEVKNDFENFLFKLRSEARTEREFLASLSSSSTTTEECNAEEEERPEKPEMHGT